MERYRFDSKGNVIRDTRRMSSFYNDPHGMKYVAGDPLFETKAPGSPARQAFKAARSARRAAVEVAS